MNQEQHIHEQIDQYLRGQMIGEDMDLFRIRMKEDKAFLHQVQLQKALIAHIEKQREAELRALFKSDSKKRSAIVISLNRRILSIAAVLLAITALAMVLKMYLPVNQMAEEIAPTEEPAIDTNQLDEAPEKGIVEVTQDSNKTVDNVTPTDLEEEAAEKADQTETLLSEDDAGEDLSALKDQEEMLDAKNIKPQKDVLLSSKKHITINYPLTNAIKTPTKKIESDSKEVLVETSGKNTKLKTDNDKVSSPTAVDTVSEFTLVNGKTITIEYWKSVVNFKGYHYNGNVLMLYEVSPESKIQVVNYDGKTYLKWGGAVYRILSNDNYEKFSRVTDTSILNVINK